MKIECPRVEYSAIYTAGGVKAMKVLTATLALLVASPAAAQECQTCSSADACIRAYIKATSQAQREVKQAIRDWAKLQTNLRLHGALQCYRTFAQQFP
jgi:hypothetical protein